MTAIIHGNRRILAVQPPRDRPMGWATFFSIPVLSGCTFMMVLSMDMASSLIRTISISLTAAIPYGSWQATEWLKLWGALG